MMQSQSNTFDKIYEVVAKIPYGHVASYGQIASLAGNKRWARVVGYAMHACQEERNLPCHRVVKKDGETSKAFVEGDIDMQKILLEKEGVKFLDGKVIMKEYQWATPWDELGRF